MLPTPPAASSLPTPSSVAQPRVSVNGPGRVAKAEDNGPSKEEPLPKKSVCLTAFGAINKALYQEREDPFSRVSLGNTGIVPFLEDLAERVRKLEETHLHFYRSFASQWMGRADDVIKHHYEKVAAPTTPGKLRWFRYWNDVVFYVDAGSFFSPIDEKEGDKKGSLSATFCTDAESLGAMHQREINAAFILELLAWIKKRNSQTVVFSQNEALHASVVWALMSRCCKSPLYSSSGNTSASCQLICDLAGVVERSYKQDDKTAWVFYRGKSPPVPIQSLVERGYCLAVGMDHSTRVYLTEPSNGFDDSIGWRRDWLHESLGSSSVLEPLNSTLKTK